MQAFSSCRYQALDQAQCDQMVEQEVAKFSKRSLKNGHIHYLLQNKCFQKAQKVTTKYLGLYCDEICAQ